MQNETQQVERGDRVSKEIEESMIDTDPDYIASKRFDYSLGKLLERYPDGCPDRVIAAVLLIEEREVEQYYTRIVEKLRRMMKVDPL